MSGPTKKDLDDLALYNVIRGMADSPAALWIYIRERNIRMANTPKAPTNAPQQTAPSTGKGQQGKTAPTFNQAPALKPKPKDNGTTNIIDNQRQPAPRGPANAAQIYGGQAQQP